MIGEGEVYLSIAIIAILVSFANISLCIWGIRKVLQILDVHRAFLDELNSEMGDILPPLPKVKTIKEELKESVNSKRKAGFFIPSKDVDYIMSGKMEDHFD